MRGVVVKRKFWGFKGVKLSGRETAIETSLSYDLEKIPIDCVCRIFWVFFTITPIHVNKDEIYPRLIRKRDMGLSIRKITGVYCD